MATGPAWADDSHLLLAPLSIAVGDAELRLGGDAGGALFGPHQPRWSGTQFSALARVMPELRRDNDSGLSLALAGTFAAADPLSRGRYDGDAIERLAGGAHHGLGTVGGGCTDGGGCGVVAHG